MQESHSCRQLSDKRFDVTHETFERSSTQQRLVLRALEELIGSHSDSSGPLRILSVGCGSGILDNQLISSIALISSDVSSHYDVSTDINLDEPTKMCRATD